MVLSDKDIRWYLKGVLTRSDGGTGYPPAWTRHHLVIDPLDESQIQPASIDLKLAGEFRIYDQHEAYEKARAELAGNIRNLTPLWGFDEKFEEAVAELTIDLDNRKASTRLIEADKLELIPGQFVLGSTVERVEIPNDLCARVEGKSSLGRLGLLVHATAGYIDPGFKGKITLEIMNLNNRPIILRADKPICQLSLIKLSSTAQRPYGHVELNSKYQNQDGVQESLYAG